MRIIPAAALLALGASAVLMQTACTGAGMEAKQKAAESGAAPVPVIPVVRASRSEMSATTVLTAEFQPYQEVDVMAKVAGYVRTLRVDIGDQVREGQLLAELEVPEMTDEVTRSSAMVDQTAAEIAAAKDELQRAESAHTIAHLSFTRLQDVVRREPGLIPQQEIDESRARDQVAEAQVASAKSKLRVEENKTRVAKAEETRLRTMRNYVTINAPFSGTVTRRYANIGAMIQAGTSSQSAAMPVVRLSQISTLRLSLPVPESLVPAVRPGQPVEVRVKSLGKSFEGRVSRTASRVDPSTRTMITEVDVPNRSGVIVPGMYAEVALQTVRHADALTVPVDAVERAGTATRVYTVGSGEVVRIASVQIGLEDPNRVEIVSGLSDSDLVITGRRTGLKAGDRIQPKLVDAGR